MMSICGDNVVLYSADAASLSRGDYKYQQLVSINARIINAAINGYSHIALESVELATPTLITELERLGYTVRRFRHDPFAAALEWGE